MFLFLKLCIGQSRSKKLFCSYSIKKVNVKVIYNVAMDTIKNIIKSIKKLERNDFSRTFKAARHCLKSESHLPKHFFSFFQWWKMMKNTFYFMLKAHHLHFCPKFLVMYKNGWIRKLRVISKLMTLQTGQQIMIILILPNISRSKSNQAMKLGQLIENNMRNVFLESHTKCDGEASYSQTLLHWVLRWIN